MFSVKSMLFLARRQGARHVSPSCPPGTAWAVLSGEESSNPLVESMFIEDIEGMVMVVQNTKNTKIASSL